MSLVTNIQTAERLTHVLTDKLFTDAQGEAITSEFSDTWSVIYNTWWDPLISAGLMILSVCVQTDLVSTIGESVALGVAGVILWGDSNYASSHVSIRASTHCL